MITNLLVQMFKTITPGLSWTAGTFAFLGCFFTLNHGFGGLIASVFFLVSGLALFPPTRNWLQPKLEEFYLRPVSQSFLVTLACFSLLIGIMAVPVDKNPENNNMVFAGEVNVEEPEEEEKQENNKKSTTPLINEIVRRGPKILGEMFASPSAAD